MLTVTNNIIKTVLASTLLVSVSNVEARLKYYRYNDNIPMVEMSLNMMVAMGVLEPIPSRLVHDGNPYHRMVTASYSPYSRSAYSYPESSHRYSQYRYNDHLDGPIDPYDRYSSSYYGSRYGYSPDYPRYRTWGNQWDSPWANRWDNQWDSPWSNSWDSPWGYQRGNPWNSGWGNSWGYQRGNPWNSSWGSPWGNQWGNQGSNPWNSGWGSPWGNTWNYQWMNPWSGATGYQGGLPYMPGYTTMPLSPDELMGNDWSKNNAYQSDDTSRQYRNKEGYKAEKTSWSGHPSSMSYRHSGNKRPNRKLNGLWIGDNGEMLGIRGNRFLWYDDDNQYAKGQLVKSPTMMKARIDGANSVVRYHYKLQGNELVIISRNGKMRTFNRMPLMQLQNASAKPQAAYSSYKPESDNAHVLYSKYGTGQQFEKTINPRHQSNQPTSSYGTNRRSDSVAPYKYYSSNRSGRSNPRDSRAVNSFRGDIASTSASTDNSSPLTRYSPEKTFDSAAVISKAAYTRDAASMRQPKTSDTADQADTIPLYKKYQPAAGKLDAVSGTDSVVTTAVDTDLESTTWNSFPAGSDMDDPNTYLYSYLKDNASVSTSANQDGSDSSGDSTVAEKNDRSNIWKPNNLFPDQRLNSDRAETELTANSEVNKYSWPNDKPWN